MSIVLVICSKSYSRILSNNVSIYIFVITNCILKSDRIIEYIIIMYTLNTFRLT